MVSLIAASDIIETLNIYLFMSLFSKIEQLLWKTEKNI